MPLPEYSPLYSDCENAESQEVPHQAEKLENKIQSQLLTLRTVLLGLGIFASGIICTLWFIEVQARLFPRHTYEGGFKEDVLLPSEKIQLAQVKFGTPVDFDKDGHEVLGTSLEDATYVGEPSQEIDDAWTQLLWGRYFSISEPEAKELWGDGYEAYQDHDKTGYTGGFDMFHQLHCLNQIRQALDRDYYPETEIHGEVHLEHCINHIRQSLMCWGSMAVVPVKYFPGYGHGYVKSDVTHTCRKFEPIREFVSERFNGSLHAPRPNESQDRYDYVY